MNFTLHFEDLKKEDFVNPEVLAAVNPHPTMGYAYGPIPHNNPGWRADNDDIHSRPTKKQIICALTSGRGPPRPMVSVNPTNTLVCDILVGNTQMCGSTFRKPGALAVHLRLRHCGAVNDVDAPRHPEETLRATGVNAIKRYVLTGGWRNAIYSKEPGRAQPESVLGVFCDALENIARNDAAFAAEYGTQFHRDVTNSLNNKLLKYLGVPKSQLEDGSSQQTTTRPSHLQKGLKPAAVAEPEPESESDYESDFESESDPDSEPLAEPTKLISKHEAGNQRHRISSVAPLAIDIVATNDIEFVSERTIKVEPDVMAGRMIKIEPNAMSELIPKIENGLVIDLTSDEPAVLVDLSTGDEPELEDASWPVEAVTDVFPISVPELEPILEPMQVSPP